MSEQEKKIAIMLANNFDYDEFSLLHSCFLDAGFFVSVVADKEDVKLQDWRGSSEILTEVSFEEARSYDFDAAVIPGRFSPDEIRLSQPAIFFVKDIFNEGKLVGAIDHGAQVLISAGILRNKDVTGWYSIKDDLINAGGDYLDEPIVTDGNIITARGSADIQEFCKLMVDDLKGNVEEAA
jgi:protease I